MVPFYLLAFAAVVSSLLVIAQRNPIYSVMLLIASFGALSGLYVLLEAPFVAVTQIIVYAGAIMVLFLFVVMLLNAPHEDTDEDLERRARTGAPSTSGLRVFGGTLAVLLGVELVWALVAMAAGRPHPRRRGLPPSARWRRSAVLLFTDYAFAFEVTSILILVAMIGAVVLARREESVD